MQVKLERRSICPYQTTSFDTALFCATGDRIDCPCVAPFDTARELERAREHYACHIMLVLMRASDTALTGR
jgi:hypothetical protein